MASKKEETKIVLERIYNIPLRKEYQKSPKWKRAKKAVIALREFLVRHMKSEDVKLGPALNEKVWQQGVRNPPHHVKVTVTKDDKGTVKAELFGVEVKKTSKVKKEKTPKKETPVEEKEGKEEVKETKAA